MIEGKADPLAGKHENAATHHPEKVDMAGPLCWQLKRQFMGAGRERPFPSRLNPNPLYEPEVLPQLSHRTRQVSPAHKAKALASIVGPGKRVVMPPVSTSMPSVVRAAWPT